GQHPPRPRLRGRGDRRLRARSRRGARARLSVLRRPCLRLPRQRAHGRLRDPDQGRRGMGQARRPDPRRSPRRGHRAPRCGDPGARGSPEGGGGRAQDHLALQVARLPRREAQGALQGSQPRDVLIDRGRTTSAGAHTGPSPHGRARSQARTRRRAMPLDPQAKAIVDAMLALNLPPTETMTPTDARESMRARTAGLGPVEEVARVEDHRVAVEGGAIAVRCYTPAGRPPFPALVFFHGGGWVIGDIETHDGICRSLANAAGCVVANVDYRLAPEHKYPAAAEDAYAATHWVAREAARLGVDPRRLAVGGD